MMPTEPQRPGYTVPAAGSESSEQSAGPVDLGRPKYHWYQKFSAVLLVVFCLEIGLFLLIFPWTPYWDSNYFGSLMPQWHAYWDNMYIRGAVSGLGVVNLYIFFLELYRLRRFAGR
jgi:hypothetical protein